MWRMDLEDVGSVLHRVAEMVTLWEMTAWEVVGFLRVGFRAGNDQSSPSLKGSLLEFHDSCGQCILWGVRDWNVGRAEETTKVSDTCSLVLSPGYFCPVQFLPFGSWRPKSAHKEQGKPRGCRQLWEPEMVHGHGAAPPVLTHRQELFLTTLEVSYWWLLHTGLIFQHLCRVLCLEKADFCIAINYQTCTVFLSVLTEFGNKN